jgi:phytoene desaturase
MSNKTAIIIGAGIGGIATSIYLAKNGFKVSVYEKNATPGGRCGHIIRDGHRFDLGATIFAMPSIYRKVFNSLGLKLEDCFEITELSTIIKIHFNNGEQIAFTTDQNKMQLQLEAIETGSFVKLKSYISEGNKFFDLAITKLLGRNFYTFFEFLNIRNALLLLRLKSYLKHYAYVGQFFKHPHLKMAFTFQNIYVGQSPYNAPAFFSMLPSVELNEGSLFLKGGMYSIVNELVSNAMKYGVRFNYNKPVTKICTNSNEAKSIILADGSEITADIIIANAELPYVYNNLLPDKKIANKINNLKYACSAIVFHWGIDKTYSQLDHHSVFLSENYKECMNKIFDDKIVDNPPSFYVHSPTRTDKTAAPENNDSLSIVIPVGHMDESKVQDWNSIKNDARTSVLERLKKAGLIDIDKHIKFEICYLPNTWKTAYNISKGAVFGSLNHNIMQMGYFRPHNKHDRYNNLYFVGGSTHPGNGVPLVLLSAKLTTDRIFKDFSSN